MRQMFKRTGKLILSVAIGIFIGVIYQGVSYAQTIQLTYANFPPATTFPCVQMERWAEEVRKRTDGKVNVKTFPGGTLLGAKNMYDGVVKGLADIGCLATAYQPGRWKLFEAMDLPFMFDNGQTASVTMWELYTKFKPKSFEDVKVLTMFTCAPAHIMSEKPVRKLADMQGVKLRAAGTGVDILKLLGAAPEGMPMSAVPEALQKGVIDGLVSSLEVMKDLKFAEYCKYVTYGNLWVVPFAVVMNKSKWESLPADVKKVFEDLGLEQAKWTGMYVDKHASDAIEWSKQDPQNVEFITLSKEEIAEAKNKVSPLVSEYLKKTQEAGLPGKEFLDELNMLNEKHRKEKQK